MLLRLVVFRPRCLQDLSRRAVEKEETGRFPVPLSELSYEETGQSWISRGEMLSCLYIGDPSL